MLKTKTKNLRKEFRAKAMLSLYKWELICTLETCISIRHIWKNEGECPPAYYC